MKFWTSLAIGAFVGNALVVPLLFERPYVDGLIVGGGAAGLLVAVGYLKRGSAR